MSGNHVRRHSQEIDAELDSTVMLLLMKHGGQELGGFCMDPGLNRNNGAFGVEMSDGRTAHMVKAVVDGPKSWAVVINMSAIGGMEIRR